MQNSETPQGFGGLGISDEFMKAIERLKFSTPTPIQHKAIPVGLSGEDLIGIAQTGTGKTVAFGVPMLQRLWQARAGLGVVILPTRELALQVNDSLKALGQQLGLRTAVLIGGESMGKQLQQLSRKPNVIIATPGRLLDIADEKKIDLSRTTVLVLDEADRMLDMGFAPQIRRIFALLPEPQDRQTMLFSATMPEDIVSIATKHMRMPVRVEVAPAGTAAEKVHQEIYIVTKEDKVALLDEMLREHDGSVLVFTRTKHGAKRLTRQLEKLGHRAGEIHANKSLAQRIKALNDFKKGTIRALVATDIAARGIDVTGIGLVVNYDLPDSSQDYVHRIGRTGRAGREGKAISFATPDQRSDIRDIERLIRKPLTIAKHEKLSAELHQVPVAQRGIRGGRVRRFGHRPRFRRSR
ncbi:MAG TPA: DEAD/DEAH box helicase [Candidatus Paceibacterota bacterium]|nr:DEAD/DEAH box helicase [Candidatus Paceibacterota bacterium]